MLRRYLDSLSLQPMTFLDILTPFPQKVYNPWFTPIKCMHLYPLPIKQYEQGGLFQRVASLQIAMGKTLLIPGAFPLPAWYADMPRGNGDLRLLFLSSSPGSTPATPWYPERRLGTAALISDPTFPVRSGEQRRCVDPPPKGNTAYGFSFQTLPPAFSRPAYCEYWRCPNTPHREAELGTTPHHHPWPGPK